MWVAESLTHLVPCLEGLNQRISLDSFAGVGYTFAVFVSEERRDDDDEGWMRKL